MEEQDLNKDGPGDSGSPIGCPCRWKRHIPNKGGTASPKT